MSSGTNDASTIATVVDCDRYLQKVIDGNQKLLREQQKFSQTTLSEQQKINKLLVESLLKMNNELADIRSGGKTEKRNEEETKENEETGKMGSVICSYVEDIKTELLPVFRLTGKDEPILTFYGNETDGDVSDWINFEQYFEAMLHAGSISLVDVGKPCGSGKQTLIVLKLVIVDDSGKDNMHGYDALIDQVQHVYQTEDGSCAVENKFDQYAAVVKSDDHYILLVGMWYGHSKPYSAEFVESAIKGLLSLWMWKNLLDVSSNALLRFQQN